MARKAKKRMHWMPPLSFLDKLIYWMILFVLCAAYIALLLGPLQLRRKIAFADEAVIAAEDNFSTWWLAVPWLTFFLMTLILWVRPYEERKPIFGRRNFKYGPPAWPKVYPLFMKNKPHVFVSERKRKERKQIAAMLLVVLLVSLIPFPWSLYGRDCLQSDGSIVQYNMFNSEVREFSSGEVESIKIETFRYSTGKYVTTSHWGVQMVFVTDSGRKYTFDQREFRTNTPGDYRYWLSAMLRVKRRYDPGIIRYEGVEDLELVIEDKKLSEKEAEMLYQLFGR